MPGSLGDRVRELRERDKLTQGELASSIGTSASTLSRIEKGEIESPGSDIVVKLARLFHVSTDFLLGITNYPDRARQIVEEHFPGEQTSLQNC